MNKNILPFEDRTPYIQFWEEGAVYVVDKIFNYIESAGSTMAGFHLGYHYQKLQPNPFLKEYSFVSSNEIDLMKSVINFYLDTKLIIHDPNEMRYTSSSNEVYNSIHANELMFLTLSHCSYRLFERLANEYKEHNFKIEDFNRKNIGDTVIRKQHDYGPNNIAKFGLHGLVIRIHDKIARLENLTSEKRLGESLVSNESVFDTCLDIIGYSVVAIMWLYGIFLTPMELDHK